MAKRGSGKRGAGGQKGRNGSTGGGSHGGDVSGLGLATPADRAGMARSGRGGGKRRSAEEKAARRSARGERSGLDRANAELRRIERGLVEAQVILAEVAARADALEERLRVIAGHSLAGSAGQVPAGAESAGQSVTTAAPESEPDPDRAAMPVPLAAIPGEAAVPEGTTARDAEPVSGPTLVTDAGPRDAAPAPDQPTARWRGFSF